MAREGIARVEGMSSWGGGGVEEGERSPKMLDFKATHFKQNVAFSIETILSTQPKGDFGR
jgi:hypothetical protein